MTRLTIPAIVALLVSGPAWGGHDLDGRGNYLDGNDLHLYCSDKADEQAAGVCYGYLIAMADALSGAKRGFGDDTYCIPSGVTSTQLRDVVKRWLNENPQDRQFAAPLVVAAAFSEAWPCTK